MTASKASASLRSSPNETAAPGPCRAMSRVGGLALAAGLARPQVDHGPAAVRLRPWSPRPSRASTAAIAARTAARAAGMSSAWRTWNATDGPLRSTNSHGGDAELAGDAGGERLGVRRVALEPGLRRDHDRARGRRAASRPCWSPWSPRYSMPPTRVALGDVGDGPAGQDRDVEPVRPAPRRPPPAGAAPAARRGSMRAAPGRASRARACRRSRR